jgi:hypothetical protein
LLNYMSPKLALNVVCCETAKRSELGAKRTLRARQECVAIDPSATLVGCSNRYDFIRNPGTSGVLSCLVPSLGGANETALQSSRRTN